MFIFTILCGASKGFMMAFKASLHPGLEWEGLNSDKEICSQI